VVEFSAINDEVRISCWEPSLESSGPRGACLGIKKAAVFFFQLRFGAAAGDDGVLAGEGDVGCPEERGGAARRNAAHGRNAG